MKHLYGIIAAETGGPFPEQVYGVSAAGFTALVSDTDLTDYRNLPQTTLLREIAQHQSVVETLAAEFALIPVQFGSLLHHDEQVRQMLSCGRIQFEETFARLQHLVQMEIAVLWDETAVVEEIAAAERLPQPAVRNKQLQLALATRQAEVEQLLLEYLQPLAQGIVRSAPDDDSDVAICLNMLLEKSDQLAFYAAVEQLEAATAACYTIHTAGPQPPQRLIRLTVRAPKPQLIEYARELLGLGFIATAADIKQAYYNHPHYMRPDPSSDLESIIKMTELAQSYKLLKELAASQGGDLCYLDPASVEQTVVISIQWPQG